MKILHRHENQSIDLQSKSIVWFLYECNFDLIFVKKWSFKIKLVQAALKAGPS